VTLYRKCPRALTFESLWQCGHAHPRRAHVQGPRGDARGGRYRGHGRRLPARGQGACTRKSGERTYTHTERERERERDVRKCTHAHSLTRAASLYRMHLPLTHACTHTHTHTHTHRWDQSPTMPSRSAPRSCGCSSPCVTQVSFVSVIGLFCLCTTSLWPLY